MLGSFTLSNVFVKKGYKNTPAVNFVQKENKIVFAGFNCSGTVYDAKAKDNKKYLNFRCKAFGDFAARLKTMKLDAGANVNITGYFDVDEWEEEETKKKRTMIVFVATNLEYNGSKKATGEASAEKTTETVPNGSTVPVDEDNTFDDLPF